MARPGPAMAAAVSAAMALVLGWLALGVSAVPLKVDATRETLLAPSAPLQANETSSSEFWPVFGQAAAPEPSESELLSMVAYGNPNRWVVRVKDDDNGDCGETVRRICREEAPKANGTAPFNGRCVWEDRESCFFTLEADGGEDDLDALLVAHEDDIVFAERDMRVVMEQSCSYPFPQTGSVPWHLDRIDSSSAQQPLDGRYQPPEGLSGSGVHLYVLDTGLRRTHVEFTGRVGQGGNVLNGADPTNEWDDNGHGTAVASVAAGTTSGVCKCCVVHGVKCLDHNGDGSYTDVISGLFWVLRNAQRPAVASMSLSGPTSLGINNAIQELYAAGILTIAAAGNENTDACTKSPGSSPVALTVGASDLSSSNEDVRSGFSNYGGCVDVYAPGSGILVADHSGDAATSYKAGTSFSAPAVAGAAALYLSQYPESTPQIQHEKVSQASTAAPTIEAGARLLNVRALDVCPSGQEAVQCRVGNWTEWAPACPPAGEMCGRPAQRRTREILEEPSCGGNVCPITNDVRYCPGDYVPCPSRFPSQWFGTNDQAERPAQDLDILGRTITYRPSNSTGFSACIADHVGYEPLESFGQATKLDMQDDSFVEVTLGDSGFSFMGQTKTTIYVGSNGYITLDEGDFSYMVGEIGGQPVRSLLSVAGIKSAMAGTSQDIKRALIQANIEGHDQFVARTGPHWMRQRISGLFQDMNPSTSGDHGIYFQAKGQGTSSSRLVVTFDRVPLWGMPEERNTFQMVLYTDESSSPGSFSIWWGQISGVYRPMVGVSPGSMPPDQIETDLVPDIGTCSGGALPAVPPPQVVAFSGPDGGGSGGSGGGSGGGSFFGLFDFLLPFRGGGSF